MRTRSRTTGSFTRVNREARTRPNCQTGWTQWYILGTTNSGTRTVKTISDVEVPGFRALLKCGSFLPLNPVSIIEESVTYTQVPFNHERISRVPPCQGQKLSEIRGTTSLADDFVFDLSIPPPNQAAIDAVTLQAIADARNHAWDVLTDLAELRETHKLFRETAKALNTAADKAIGKALTVAFRGPRAVAKAFASGWLQYRYGWMPLAYSLQDAAKALSATQQKFAIGRGSLNESDVFVKTVDQSNCRVAAFTTQTLTYDRSYRGWAAAQIDWQNRFGFDPIKTAWELVPFSFVMDWFLQVGTWIEAFSPFAAGSTLGSMASIRTNSVYEVRLDHDGRYCSDDNTDGSGAVHATVYSKSVSSYERFPHSPFLPPWNPRINLPRMTDAISLAMGINVKTRQRLRV